MEEYEEPKTKAIAFENEDIIRESDPDDPGEWGVK